MHQVVFCLGTVRAQTKLGHPVPVVSPSPFSFPRWPQLGSHPKTGADGQGVCVNHCPSWGTGPWTGLGGGNHFRGAAPCGHSPHGVGTCLQGKPGETFLSSLASTSQQFGRTAWEPRVRREVPGLFYKPLGESQCIHK